MVIYPSGCKISASIDMNILDVSTKLEAEQIMDIKRQQVVKTEELFDFYSSLHSLKTAFTLIKDLAIEIIENPTSNVPQNINLSDPVVINNLFTILSNDNINEEEKETITLLIEFITTVNSETENTPEPKLFSDYFSKSELEQIKFSSDFLNKLIISEDKLQETEKSKTDAVEEYNLAERQLADLLNSTENLETIKSELRDLLNKKFFEYQGIVEELKHALKKI
jgi:hypothetical protein